MQISRPVGSQEFYDQNFYLFKSDQIVLDMGQKIGSKYSFMIKTSIYSNIEYIVLDV